MLARDSIRVKSLRMIVEAIKNFEINNRVEVSEQQELAILATMVKQRKESISKFQQANRQDLIDIEENELSIISEFLPTQLNVAEITTLIKKIIAEQNPKGIKDMGKIMAILKPQIQGRADMSAVSQQLKLQLTQI